MSPLFFIVIHCSKYCPLSSRVRYKIFGSKLNIATYVEFDTGEVDECGLKETLYLMPCRILGIHSMNDVARAKTTIRNWAVKLEKKGFDGTEDCWDEHDIIKFWF